MYEFFTTPMERQFLAYAKGRPVDTFGLLMAPGTGKTKVDLDDSADQWLHGEIDTHIVLAPNRVHKLWPGTQAETHIPHIPVAGATYRAGSAASRREIAAALQHKDRLRIIAFNIECASHDSGIDAIEEVMERGGRIKLTIDESQRIKHSQSKRTKRLIKLGEANCVVRKRIATGSAVTTGYENLYAQFKFLDPKIIGVHSFTEFTVRYCHVFGKFRNITGYKNIEELQDRIRPYVFVDDGSALDLPPLVTMPRLEVELTPQQRRHYDDIKKEFLTELASGRAIDANSAIKRMQKLMQITAGHIQYGKGRWEAIPTHRWEAVADLVEDYPHKTIVWVEWQPDVIQCVEALKKRKIRGATYYGGNTTAQNEKHLELFRQRDDAKVLVATAATGSVGLTINEAKHVICATHGTSFENREQLLKRNHRIGQEMSPTLQDLFAPKTIDVDLLKAYEKGFDVAAVMKDPAKFMSWLLETDVY